MSLFGGGNSASQQAPALSAISIQTMGYGVPIQICYGSNRVSPTLGYTNDFVAIEHKGSNGGKGLGGGGGSVSYTYQATVLFFVCEGPVRSFGKSWRNKEIASVSDYDSGTGTYPQSAWGYVETYHPEESLGYSGTALIGAGGYDLGSTGSLGNHSFEVHGRCLSITDTDQNFTDAHVKDVISDFLTNPHYGAIAAQTAVLTLDTVRMHDYCRAMGIVISPLLNSKKPAHEYLTQWAMVANAGLVWSEGVLKFISYADESITGNGTTYTADNAIRYVFNDDNVAEPIRPKRKKPADCFNKLTVECLDRANDYNKCTVDAADQASIDQFGLRPASTITLDCICLPGIALQVAHTQLLHGLYIRNEYTIQCYCDADLLEPLDFITLTDSGLAMDAVRCRVVSVEDDQEGKLTIVAEEAPEGIYNG